MNGYEKTDHLFFHILYVLSVHSGRVTTLPAFCSSPNQLITIIGMSCKEKLKSRYF